MNESNIQSTSTRASDVARFAKLFQAGYGDSSHPSSVLIGGQGKMKSSMCSFHLLFVAAFLFLSLGQVRAAFVNLARSGTATQSSTFGGTSEAWRANDGITDGDYHHLSVSHTEIGDPAPWWQVDLGGTSAISRIVLWNRTDCCGDRLSNFNVTVLDESRSEVFAGAYFTDGNGSFAESFAIDLPRNTKGRHVRITLGPSSSDLRILALAEVEVLAVTARENGDVNGSGRIDLSDAVYLLNTLFLGGPKPVPIFEPLAHFKDNGDGTVTDQETGLMWQKDTAPGTYTWQAAVEYCDNLQLAGRDDWRLPEVWELWSIVDHGRQNPAIDPVFGYGASPFWYWSVTYLGDNPNTAWFTTFYKGGGGYGSKGNSNSVRAVRGGR